MITRLQDNISVKDVGLIDQVKIDDPVSSNEHQEDDFVGTVVKGVEVINVKPIPKVDRFGIPIKGSRKTLG